MVAALAVLGRGVRDLWEARLVLWASSLSSLSVGNRQRSLPWALLWHVVSWLVETVLEMGRQLTARRMEIERVSLRLRDGVA